MNKINIIKKLNNNISILQTVESSKKLCHSRKRNVFIVKSINDTPFLAVIKQN